MADRLSIVDTWLTVATGNGEPYSVALAELNAELGTAYGASRLGEWRNGRRAIPQPVQDYMLRVAIEHAIRAAGGSPPIADAALDGLARRLCPPPRA